MRAGSVRLFGAGCLVVVALLFFGLRPLYMARFREEGVLSLALGLAACLGVVGASFFLLRWAIGASNAAFHLAFAGGIAGRLLILGALVGISRLAPGVNGTGVAFAVITAFFPLTILELFCVLRGKSGSNERDRRDDTPGRSRAGRIE